MSERVEISPPTGTAGAETSAAPTNGFGLVVTQGNDLVHCASYSTARERRDACVAVLKTTTDQVEVIDVLNILLNFGGAAPDAATDRISTLYAKYDVDVYLEDNAPAVSTETPLVHSVFISHNHSVANEIIHFPTLDLRESYLRLRLAETGAASPITGVSHDTLAAKLQHALAGSDGPGNSHTIHLLTSLQPSWVL